MAIIPSGEQLGNVRIEPRRMGGMGGPSNAIAQGLADLGQGISNAVEQDQQLKRAKAGNAVLDRQLQVRTLVDDLGRQLRDGSLTYDAAPKAYQDSLSKLSPAKAEGLGGIAMEEFNQSIRRLDEGGLQGLMPAINESRRATFKQQVDLGIDTIGKQVGLGADVGGLNKHLDAFDQLGQEAYGQNWARVKQEARDRNWYNQANQRAIQGRDNLQALQQLETELSDPKGFYADKLDADKRNSLLRGVVTDRSQIETRAQHAADRREAAALRTIDSVDRHLSSGVPATTEMWNSWLGDVKGTSQEAELRVRMQEETEIQDVLRQPIEQQTAYLQKRQAALMSAGGTIREQANLQRLTTAVQGNIKQLQDAPLLFTQNRTGVAVEPIDLTQMVQPGGAQQIAAQMQDRITSIQATQKQYGTQVKMRPLLPQEAAGLSSVLEQSAPRQARDLLSGLRQAIGDDGAFQAAMQQIAPDSPVKALAGVLAAKQRKLTLESNWFSDDVVATSGDIAMTLLSGESILNKSKDQKAADGQGKAFPLPPEKDFRSSFSNVAGNVFAGRPQAYEAATQAVRAYYTGRAAQDGDVSGAVDGTRMRQAVKAVLGNVVDLNGNGDVLAPWGMDTDTFKDRAQASFRAEMKRQGFPQLGDQYHAFGLRNIGDGTYYVTQGRAFLAGKDGKPLTINLAAPAGGAK